MNREDNNKPQQPEAEEQVLDLEDDTPLAPVCVPNEDGVCEVCQ